MNMLRTTLALAYAICAYVGVGAAETVWRASQAPRVDWLYLMGNALILVLLVGAAGGLLLKRIWGPIWVMMLCAVIVVLHVGVTLMFVFMTGGSARQTLDPWWLSLDAVAIVTLALFLTPAFRRQYAANMTPNQTRAKDARAG